jgi:TRAP-type mannitol/chloroaromatic compound transport system permease small subunit
MRKFVVVIDAISAWVGRIASFLMVPCVIAVIWEVSMRYIFHRPTLWASETILFLTGYLTIFGAAWQSISIKEGSGTPWNPPIYYIKAAFTISLSLLFLQGIAKFIRDLFLMAKGKEL